MARFYATVYLPQCILYCANMMKENAVKMKMLSFKLEVTESRECNMI